MENCTDLEKTSGNLPDKPVASNQAVGKAAAIAALPLPEAESNLAVEIDRIQEISAADPLGALDEMLGLLTGINAEMLKLMAPVLLENTNLRAIEFHAKGKLTEPSRGEARAMTSMHKTEETIAKLMAGRVKVRDEMARRGRTQPAQE